MNNHATGSSGKPPSRIQGGLLPTWTWRGGEGGPVDDKKYTCQEPGSLLLTKRGRKGTLASREPGKMPVEIATRLPRSRRRKQGLQSAPSVGVKGGAVKREERLEACKEGTQKLEATKKQIFMGSNCGWARVIEGGKHQCILPTQTSYIFNFICRHAQICPQSFV